MKASLLLGVLAIFGGLVPRPAGAHDSPPGLLEILPAASGIEVRFRIPRLDGAIAAIEASFPDSYRDVALPERVDLPDAELRRRMLSGTVSGLAGQRVAFPGLEQTGIDVLVRVGGGAGADWTAVARAGTPYVDLPAEWGWWGKVRTFTVEGARHILLGPDHLLFALGLLLLVRSPWSLTATVTSFTLAHSTTLAVATFGLAIPPVRLLNALIALSILYLGVEAAASGRGERTFTGARPWVAAFIFGLLHGFGFAGALTEAGLPRSSLPVALVSFNIGIELGQLGVVALAAAVLSGWRGLQFPPRRWVALAPGYAVGSLGAFWTIERGMAALEGIR